MPTRHEATIERWRHPGKILRDWPPARTRFGCRFACSGHAPALAVAVERNIAVLAVEQRAVLAGFHRLTASSHRHTLDFWGKPSFLLPHITSHSQRSHSSGAAETVGIAAGACSALQRLHTRDTSTPAPFTVSTTTPHPPATTKPRPSWPGNARSTGSISTCEVNSGWSPA